VDLVRVATTSTTRPDPIDAAPFTGGDDGQPIDDNDISDPNLEGAKQGLWALEKADLFNLLCIPPLTLEDGGDIGGQTRSAADAYCNQAARHVPRRSLSDWDKPADAIAPTGVDGSVFGLARKPELRAVFPTHHIAGSAARTASSSHSRLAARWPASWRGPMPRAAVWKAPAGIEATLSGVIRPHRQHDRPRERAAQSARRQLPALVPGDRPGELGRAHA